MLKHMIAVDLGASSGRLILGKLEDGKLSLEEIHRFRNGAINVCGSMHWDILALYREILEGLNKYSLKYPEVKLDSVAIDTWGVDYGLIDKNGDLIGNPYSYRDGRTVESMEKAIDKLGKDNIWAHTGIAFQQFNTLFQLYADELTHPELLAQADKALLTPDLLAYFLTGVKTAEFTITSTGQLLNAETGKYDEELLGALGIPTGILADIVKPGTIKGKLRPEIVEAFPAQECFKDTVVIATAGHDTASAVAAVPGESSSEATMAYISSGTWSLMGIESPVPVLAKSAMEDGLTNEGGVFDTYRVLKNIMGLWIIQECKRQWDAEGCVMGFGEIAAGAAKEAPAVSFIDPDDVVFLPAGNMPKTINEYLTATGQKLPETKFRMARIIFESLAKDYAKTLKALEKLSKAPIKALNIVGGGTQNKLLNQLTANETGIPVITGPVEATAIGNLLIQAYALGAVGSLSELREVVKASFETEVFMPQ